MKSHLLPLSTFNALVSARCQNILSEFHRASHLEIKLPRKDNHPSPNQKGILGRYRWKPVSSDIPCICPLLLFCFLTNFLNQPPIHFATWFTTSLAIDPFLHQYVVHDSAASSELLDRIWDELVFGVLPPLSDLLPLKLSLLISPAIPFIIKLNFDVTFLHSNKLFSFQGS